MAKRISNAELVEYIEEQIKKYNKKPEKKIKKKDIADLLKDAEIIVPVKIDFDDIDIYDETVEGAILNPDVVKNGEKTRLMPVFTTYEQIPRDYMDEFSLVRMSATEAYSFMNNSEDLCGIVINPFTECNLELRKKKNIPVKTENHHREVTQESSYDEPTAMIIYQNTKYSINKSPFIIGRENADIVIPKSYISKIHAVISFKDGKYRIADYESTNGTKVNDTTLRPKVYYELRDGYEIELSDKEKMIVYII